MLRRTGPILVMLALGACGDRRSFDERYNETGTKLEEKARALDQNLANELPPEEQAEPAKKP